jgi:hypothetical protein
MICQDLYNFWLLPYFWSGFLMSKFGFSYVYPKCFWMCFQWYKFQVLIINDSKVRESFRGSIYRLHWGCSHDSRFRISASLQSAEWIWEIYKFLMFSVAMVDADRSFSPEANTCDSDQKSSTLWKENLYLIRYSIRRVIIYQVEGWENLQAQWTRCRTFSTYRSVSWKPGQYGELEAYGSTCKLVLYSAPQSIPSRLVSL